MPAPLLARDDMRTLERLSLASLEALVAGLVGRRQGPGHSAGFEFTDYRRYSPGDDIRRIDWNVYARLHELHITTAPDETRLWLSVLVDTSSSMDSGTPSKLRWSRRLAALLAAVAVLRDDEVEVHGLSDGTSVSGGSFSGGTGVLNALVAELQRMPAGRMTTLDRSIRRAARSGRQPEMAVLISDGLVPASDRADAIAELARSARSTVLVHIGSAAEAAAGPAGSVVLLDSETGERVTATITADVQARYAARYAAFLAEVQKQCAARGVRYVHADATVDPLELLLDGARDGRLVRSGPLG
ncbi:MAG TPA: DUF58 domain-containing protein [Solirubrobacteraceae bacterium]|nr:DUF58 domain-containing protein [Solirubrobacteraceae bacterium]